MAVLNIPYGLNLKSSLVNAVNDMRSGDYLVREELSVSKDCVKVGEMDFPHLIFHINPESLFDIDKQRLKKLGQNISSRAESADDIAAIKLSDFGSSIGKKYKSEPNLDEMW